MTTKGNIDVIGVLVGKIMEGTNPLVYTLYSRHPHTHASHGSQYNWVDECKDLVDALVVSMGDAVVSVWRNTAKPPWYFIQLRVGWTTKDLRTFALPYTVHNSVWMHIRTE